MGIQINGTNDVISAADGSLTILGTELKDLSQLNVTGVATAASLVVSGNASIGGTITYMDVSNVDSVGIITAQQGLQVLANGLDVTGFSTFSSGVSVTGVVTATSFSGDGSNLTGIDATQIVTGNTSVQTVDTGSDGHVKITTEGTERLRINSSGDVGVGTATPRSALDLAEKTDAVALPQGTTAQRPTGDNPYLRWNTTNSALEFYNGTDWVEIISDYFPSGSTIFS